MTSSKFSKPELRYVEKIDFRVKTLFIDPLVLEFERAKNTSRQYLP